MTILSTSRPSPSHYHKIAHDAAAIVALFVDHVLEAHREAPKQIILDLNANDDPLHGDQFSNRGVGSKALRTRFAISRENSPLATLA